MSCWALVAIKAGPGRKARLAGCLAPSERDRLAETMFQGVLAALRGSRSIDGVAVVTAEPGRFDSQVLVLEDPGTGLNEALTSAAVRLQERGVTRLLVVHADLPFVTAAEIDEFIVAGLGADVVVAPDRHGTGTNALCLRLPTPFEFCFGVDSHARHRSEAARQGLYVRSVKLPGLELDVDEPADLAELGQRGDARYAFVAGEGHGREAWRGPVRNLQAGDAPRLSRAEARALVSAPAAELVEAAEATTLRGHGCAVSYSRKVFIPITQLCRNVCRYCTFAQVPAEGTPAYLSPEQVLEIARAGAAAGCKEALFTLGDKPELRYRAARTALEALGCSTTLEYVEKMARLVHETTGLLVHINPGVMSDAEIARLRPVSVSMGMMLESASERLCERGGPHWGCPDKAPGVRLATLRAAGEQQVAFTSGLLIGIGETREERIESLLALRDVHDAHGHLQEIIIQNFRAKPGTVMADAPEPPLEEHLWTIAAARLIFGPSMSIQAPPNLRAHELEPLIRAGVNDWGGVSPVTPDHVNPEAPWPQIAALAAATESAGRRLVERLALTPAYVRTLDRWVDPAMQAAVLRQADAFGRAREFSWHAGQGHDLPITTAAWVRHGRAAATSEIRQVLRRADAGRGLSEADIVRLFDAQGPDLQAVLGAADQLRAETVGDGVSYVVNCNINYTNICGHRCGFCAFAKGRSAASLRGPAYNLDAAQVAQRAVEAWQRGATEVCLQGGIHPEYTGHTYLDIVKAVKRAVPQMHVHAFSPLEVRHGAQSLGLSLRDYLRELQSAGLATLPGTAAEILDDEVRAVICPDKLDTAQWLEVIREAHALGLRTTATIMFGHVDRPIHWARHLLRIRELQQQTGGFTEFVPLPFVHVESPLWRRGGARSGPTLREAVLMHAVARLALHPLIRSVQTSWVKMGPKGAALCLQAGANDLGGTLMYESITRAAGGVNGQEFDAAAMTALAGGLGRPAWQRTTLYGRVPLDLHGQSSARCIGAAG